MDILQPDVPNVHSRREFYVIMRTVGMVLAFVCKQLPFLSVAGTKEPVLVIDAGLFAQESGVLVGVVDLDGIDGGDGAEVGLEPFAFEAGRGAPIGLYVFVDGIVGRMAGAQGRRDRNGFLIVQQHPAGKSAGLAASLA